MPVKKKKRRICCIVESVFGRNLYEAVRFVGTVTILLATVSFIAAAVSLLLIIRKNLPCGKDPVLASNLMTIMVFLPMSIYQILISILLLYQAIKCDMGMSPEALGKERDLKGDAFLGYLWLTSHICIACIYGLLFIIKLSACFYKGYYLLGVISLISGITYEALIIYFIVIVNSYLELSELEICYF